jgi:hypothetical protein
MITEHCSEPGCNEKAECRCHGCERPFCHRHVKRGTWYDGNVYDRCVDCEEPPEQVQ